KEREEGEAFGDFTIRAGKEREEGEAFGDFTIRAGIIQEVLVSKRDFHA
ncbi:hypothetical protein HKB36_05240, partial [Vibrio parahaemolyticus]|nr:hypothetical protein [Vibrio parahaemolyticus]